MPFAVGDGASTKRGSLVPTQMPAARVARQTTGSTFRWNRLFMGERKSSVQVLLA